MLTEYGQSVVNYYNIYYLFITIMKLKEFKSEYGVFTYSAASEKMFENVVSKPKGYKRISTFFADFSIAEFCLDAEPKAIIRTYKNAIKSWKEDYKMLAELVLTLNHKCWFWYQNEESELSGTYSDLYYRVKDLWWDAHGKNEEAVEYWFEWID